MLVFRARPRKNPTADAKLTNSERRVMRALNSAMNTIREQVARDEGKYLDAIMHLSANRVANMIPTDPWFDAAEQLRDELLSELIAAGNRVKLPPMEKATASFQFDASRPEAARWAEKEAGLLIREVVQEQVNVVRDYVARADMGEATPRQVARGLRDVIGLTSTQAGWVENFRNRQINERMLAGQTFEQAYESSERATSRYHDRIHRYRTETIARTEILRSVNEGRNQAWEQGIREGWINTQNWLKEWSTEIDGRECEICGPLNEMTIDFNDVFPEGEPPIHPNCRCDVLLVPKPVDDDIAAMTDDEVDAYIDELLLGEGLEQILGDALEPTIPEEAILELTDYEFEEDVDEWLETVGVDLGPDEDTEPDAWRAWDDYGGDDYAAMNSRLRRSDDIGSDATARKITDLSEYINETAPLNSNIRVYRGMTNVGDLSFEPGSTFVHQGFMSTTPIEEVAGQFADGADPVIFRITAPAGSKAVAGAGAGELEIIFGPGTKMKIIDSKEDVIDGRKVRVINSEVQL